MYLEYSLWDKLSCYDKPLFLYGTGNGADKIIAALEKYKVELTGVFASDEFVRDRYFHGYHVKSYSDVVHEYGNNIGVLLAFGTTLPSLRNFIEQLDLRHDLYIPDVPLYGGELFDYSYFSKHIEKFEFAKNLLYDKKSRSIFTDAVNFRLGGKLKFLKNTDKLSDTLSELLSCSKIETIIDGGAFKGDSAETFVSKLSPKTIYAMEADPKTYIKLKKYSLAEKRSNIIPINSAIWNYDGEIEYSSSGSRGSGESGTNKRAKTSIIKCIRLDTFFNDVKIDFIKLDIEGAESEALSGGVNLICANQPDMAISLYHRTDDLYKLIIRIHELLPKHKLYIRRVDCIPMWDLTLYAIK